VFAPESDVSMWLFLGTSFTFIVVVIAVMMLRGRHVSADLGVVSTSWLSQHRATDGQNG
jgi:hypothetical protein